VANLFQQGFILLLLTRGLQVSRHLVQGSVMRSIFISASTRWAQPAVIRTACTAFPQNYFGWV
jgi:hypothetical protein